MHLGRVPHALQLLHDRFDAASLSLDDLDASMAEYAAAVESGRAPADGWPEWVNIPSKVGQVAAMRIMAQIAEEARDRAALGWRREVMELEPRSTQDALALASCALQFGDTNTAEKSLFRLDDSGKHGAAFHAAAARLAKARRNPEEAKNEWDEALRLAPCRAFRTMTWR